MLRATGNSHNDTFVRDHWGDIVGLFLILLGVAVIAVDVWKLGDNPRLFGVGSGLINGGMLAVKLTRHGR